MAAYRRRSVWVHTVLSLILGVVIWQLLAAHTSALLMVPLGDIWSALMGQIKTGQIWINLSATLKGFILGFLIASVIGVTIGVIMGVSRTAFDFLDPWVSALYSTPLIALAPLYIIMFGIGIPAKIAIVTTVGVFPVAMNTLAGIRTTDVSLMECAHSFGASRLQKFTKIMIPASVPFIVTGLRLAVGRGLTGVVVAEFFGARAGVGFSVFAASQVFDTASLWLGVFILAAVGVILIKLMYRLERWIAPWRESTNL